MQLEPSGRMDNLACMWLGYEVSQKGSSKLDIHGGCNIDSR